MNEFQFKDHLVAASLFFPEHVGEYCAGNYLLGLSQIRKKSFKDTVVCYLCTE
ncbi:unnamed protein product [Acanthoscelides obtectus]|uniref:Uncharacterized protein n=1 Tax=Acanthoscelides obtectus TaxID=200917 RepID=A0A9P0LKU8_ACAOB|nr:unnamed protein product [Acanthoscelides obtectus]CAK1635393.1 hypothetical protein AOBTE_LOCUS9249 [Acanthoscelides obtectus]